MGFGPKAIATKAGTNCSPQAIGTKAYTRLSGLISPLASGLARSIFPRELGAEPISPTVSGLSSTLLLEFHS